MKRNDAIVKNSYRHTGVLDELNKVNVNITTFDRFSKKGFVYFVKYKGIEQKYGTDNVQKT